MFLPSVHRALRSSLHGWTASVWSPSPPHSGLPPRLSCTAALLPPVGRGQSRSSSALCRPALFQTPPWTQTHFVAFFQEHLKKQKTPWYDMYQITMQCHCRLTSFTLLILERAEIASWCLSLPPHLKIKQFSCVIILWKKMSTRNLSNLHCNQYIIYPEAQARSHKLGRDVNFSCTFGLQRFKRHIQILSIYIDRGWYEYIVWIHNHYALTDPFKSLSRRSTSYHLAHEIMLSSVSVFKLEHNYVSLVIGLSSESGSWDRNTWDIINSKTNCTGGNMVTWEHGYVNTCDNWEPDFYSISYHHSPSQHHVGSWNKLKYTMSRCSVRLFCTMSLHSHHNIWLHHTFF